MLIEIGQRLDTCLRVSDVIGRFGGDRFGIVLAHCPAEHIGARRGEDLDGGQRCADRDRRRPGLRHRLDRRRIAVRVRA